jgi:TonB family protein
VDPQEKSAYYSLGVIDWKKWYPVWLRAREQLGMKPDDSGPLPNASARRDLMERYGRLIEHGIWNLETALRVDPMYHDAMAYMNLLIRERADLRDSIEDYRRDIALGDQWVEKALETMRAKARAETRNRALHVPVMSPVRKIEPIYPPLAKQARIQGTVCFTAIIDKDGQVQDLQLIRGHPLLVNSARDAVSQWEYRPMLLNGEPIDVITQVDVDFTFGLTVQQ